MILLQVNYMNSLKVPLMASKTILLIDDEINVRELVQLCLKDLGGWNVLTVNSASEGLQRAILDRPDAIVLDISLREMDGLMFVELLRKNPETKDIPVVLLSGKVRWLSSRYLRLYGIVGAIAKPFDPAILSAQIAQLLNWD